MLTNKWWAEYASFYVLDITIFQPPVYLVTHKYTFLILHRIWGPCMNVYLIGSLLILIMLKSILCIRQHKTTKIFFPTTAWLKYIYQPDMFALIHQSVDCAFWFTFLCSHHMQLIQAWMSINRYGLYLLRVNDRAEILTYCWAVHVESID